MSVAGPGNLGGSPKVPPASRAGMWPVDAPATNGFRRSGCAPNDERRRSEGDEEPPPATGAWRPGDDPGRRQFMRMAVDRPFVLEGGGQLRDVTVAYETWGTLDADGANAVLVCHACTGDSHAAGPAGAGHPTPGWWDDLIGPGLALDTDRYFVVCANVLGGCQGSTGPASPHPDDGRPYGSRFPVVSIRDMVRTQARAGRRTSASTAGSASSAGRWAACRCSSGRSCTPSGWRRSSPSPPARRPPPSRSRWWSTGRRAIRLDPELARRRLLRRRAGRRARTRAWPSPA